LPDFFVVIAKCYYWVTGSQIFKKLTGNMPRFTCADEKKIRFTYIFSYQNPTNFWKQIKKENERGNKIRIKFIGTADPEIKKSITEEELNDITEYCGFLPYSEMLKNISEADFLLVCASEPRHVPGKLFEYLRTGNPIIAFGNNNEEVRQILDNSNAGMMFNYDESGEDFFTNYKNYNPEPSYVVRFDRERVAAEMAQILSHSSL